MISAPYLSESAACDSLLDAGWDANGDGSYMHGAALAHVACLSEGYCILITRQDVAREPA